MGPARRGSSDSDVDLKSELIGFFLPNLLREKNKVFFYWSEFIINYIFLYTHIYENPFPEKQTEKATIKRFLITNERPVFSRTTGD